MDGTEKEKEKGGPILSWRVQLHPQFSLILPLFLSCSMHCILQATVRRSFSTGRLVPTEKWKIGGESAQIGLFSVLFYPRRRRQRRRRRRDVGVVALQLLRCLEGEGEDEDDEEKEERTMVPPTHVSVWPPSEPLRPSVPPQSTAAPPK